MKLEEFISQLERRDAVEPIPFDLGDATFTEQAGGLGILLGGQDKVGKKRFVERKVSEEALQDFCTVLGAPYSFVRKCSSKLQERILEEVRLKKVEKNNLHLRGFLSSDGSCLHSFSFDNFQRYSSKRIFEEGVLSQIPVSEHSGIDFQEIRFLDKGWEIQIILSQMQTEVRVGDITKAGLNFGFCDRGNSFSDGSCLHIGGYLHRLICSNGAVNRECIKFGRVKEEDFAISRVADLTNKVYSSLTGLLESLHILAEKKVIDVEGWIRATGKQYGFGDRMVKRILEAYRQEPDPTEYGLINAVTRAANGENITAGQRSGLQRIGGRLFSQGSHSCPICRTNLWEREGGDEITEEQELELVSPQ